MAEPQLSVAVAAKVTTTLFCPRPAATVMLAGQLIVGPCKSLTVTECEQVAVLPKASVAVQVSVTVPPQASGVAENVDRLEVPLISQLPLKPFVKDKVVGTKASPQAAFDADLKAKLGESGIEVSTSTPEELQRLIARDIKVHAELVKAAGLVPQ